MLTYALRLAYRYDGMVLATVPDVPEAMAVGRDDEEACEQALRALESALDDYVAQGRPLPASRTAGTVTVTTVRFEMLAPA